MRSSLSGLSGGSVRAVARACSESKHVMRKDTAGGAEIPPDRGWMQSTYRNKASLAALASVRAKVVRTPSPRFSCFDVTSFASQGNGHRTIKSDKQLPQNPSKQIRSLSLQFLEASIVNSPAASGWGQGAEM